MPTFQVQKISEVYGTGKSKYAAAFRRVSSQSEKTNIATFKLVSKNFYKEHNSSLQGAKSQDDAKYITIASDGSSLVLANGKNSAEGHSENRIVKELVDQGESTDIESGVTSKDPNYRDLSFDKYWIAWVYSERAPCHSDNYESNCSSLLFGLHARQCREDGPDFRCYFSFDGENIGDQILTAIPTSPVKLSKNNARSTRLEEDLNKDAQSF